MGGKEDGDGTGAGDEQPEVKRRRVVEDEGQGKGDGGGDEVGRGSGPPKAEGAGSGGGGTVRFDFERVETLWEATGPANLVLFLCQMQREDMALRELTGLVDAHGGGEAKAKDAAKDGGGAIPVGIRGYGQGVVALAAEPGGRRDEDAPGEDVLAMSSCAAGTLVGRIYAAAAARKLRTRVMERAVPIRWVCDGSDPEAVEVAVLEAVSGELKAWGARAKAAVAGEGVTVKYAITAKLKKWGAPKKDKDAAELKAKVIRSAARAVETAAERYNAGAKDGEGKVNFRVDLHTPDVVIMLHMAQGAGDKVRLMVGWVPARFIRPKKLDMVNLKRGGN